MPFIEQERRQTIDAAGLESLDKIQPGDLCYIHYKNMLDQWRENPSWTTAHEIYKHWFTNTDPNYDDDAVAAQLAWQVFFQLYVMPYELEKRKLNGDV